MSNLEDPYTAARNYWRNFKRQRPEKIEKPGPGQESVWDYPRPPSIEPFPRRIRVVFADLILAETTRAWKVAETASPPVYYLPPEDVQMQYLSPATMTTFCEWKGAARYWDLQVGEQRVENAAWSYPAPDEGYQALRDHLAFYAGSMEACYVDDQRVIPQPGNFYGGWITPEITGPFKGEPGTENW